jgi:prolipoprotein diacylglyceryltransferase
MSPRALYAIFMGLALAVGLVARHFVPRPPALRDEPWWKRGGIALAAFVGGALGAKLPFVLSGEEGWLTGSAWIADGKSVVFGMIAAYLAVEGAKLALGVTAKTGDTFALPLALGMAVGRWGCFFNGCCAGTATALPWGMDFGDGVARHPTQLYEIGFHLGMAVVIFFLMRSGALRLQRLKLYLIGYGMFRFSIEFLRTEPEWGLGLTVYQWASLALVLPLVLQWRRDSKLAAEGRAA